PERRHPHPPAPHAYLQAGYQLRLPRQHGQRRSSERLGSPPRAASAVERRPPRPRASEPVDEERSDRQPRGAHRREGRAERSTAVRCTRGGKRSLRHHGARRARRREGGRRPEDRLGRIHEAVTRDRRQGNEMTALAPSRAEWQQLSVPLGTLSRSIETGSLTTRGDGAELTYARNYVAGAAAADT